MYVEWVKKPSGEWFLLNEFQLSNPRARGVYIIWKTDSDVLRPSSVIRIGRGNIVIRLSIERADARVSQMSDELRVTWAEVEDAYAAGVEAYLTQLLRPVSGASQPLDVEHVSVNLPVSA